MTWNYRVVCYTKPIDPKFQKCYDEIYKTGKISSPLYPKGVYVFYKVVEVYYDEEGNYTSWTQDGIDLDHFESYDDLKGSYDLIAEAFTKPFLHEYMKDGVLVLSPTPPKDNL
jgi:hypothetical protein